jgi:hypothetical protein
MRTHACNQDAVMLGNSFPWELLLLLWSSKLCSCHALIFTRNPGGKWLYVQQIVTPSLTKTAWFGKIAKPAMLVSDLDFPGPSSSGADSGEYCRKSTIFRAFGMYLLASDVNSTLSPAKNAALRHLLQTYVPYRGETYWNMWTESRHRYHFPKATYQCLIYD